ncbi:hypothetical protein [Kitasatospora aureofaciens]|uniref:hypothetical protein n=1 Tax=Kitasatospora aureofaciens TaxID=1894 RepID=UPI003F4CE9C7
MPALGPPLGGYLTEHLPWHWLFPVNLPIGAAVTIGLVALRTSSEPPAGRFDTRGFLLATPGLGLLTYALGFGPTAGPSRRSHSADRSVWSCSARPSTPNSVPPKRCWTSDC